jgi:hypothetical protein
MNVRGQEKQGKLSLEGAADVYWELSSSPFSGDDLVLGSSGH